MTVRGVALRVERRVPWRVCGVNDTDLGAVLSAVLGFKLDSLIVMRGMVVGAGGLSVKTSATCWSALCWRGVSSVRSGSVRGSMRILLRSSIVAWRRSRGVATGSASLPGIHVTELTMLEPFVSGLQTWWQRYESSAGPMYQASIACVPQLVRCDGLMWARQWIPGGASGVRLQSKRPESC